MDGRLSGGARRALQEAEAVARVQGAECLTADHLLAGLLRDEQGRAAFLMRTMEMDREGLATALRERLPHRDSKAPSTLAVSPEFRRAVDLAQIEASEPEGTPTDTGHLLIALVQNRESGAGRLLERFGLGAEALRTKYRSALDEA